MKTLSLLALCLMMAGLAQAANQLELEWTYPTGVTDLAGFKLYQTGIAAPIADIKTPSARTQTVSITALPDGNACYTMTAYDASQESPHSPEYCFDPPPPAPGGLRLTVTVTVNVGG